MDVHAKFGDSRSNGSRDIRGTYFMFNEPTNMTVCHMRQERLTAVSPKNGARLRKSSQAKMALGRILVAQRFACPTN